VDSGIERLIAAFPGLHVLVVGDVMLDGYLEGRTERLCREAPVPVVTVDGSASAPGGAANTAVNVAALGARVTLLSVTGRDEDAAMLRRVLRARGVTHSAMIADPSRRTLAKRRVSADGQMIVRFDEGTIDPVEPPIATELIARLRTLWHAADAVIVSDYGYGVLTSGMLHAIGRLQAALPRVLVADSKHLTAYRELGVTAVKPNYGEAVRLLDSYRLDEPHERLSQIKTAGARLLELTGARIAAVTLDTQGALVFERGCPPYRTYAAPRPHSRAAGAGDTFLSALTLALAAGAETSTAAELASTAAAIVVAKEGTAACSARELHDAFGRLDKHVEDTRRLAELAERYRQQGKRIVFTNGCFDILHRGHIAYLNRAKELGDVLIVGVNGDESVRRLKGPNRPINSLEDRMQVLGALSCVDHTVAFDDDRPDALINAARPHVFVKGGDYTLETLPEAPLVRSLGGAVEILPFVEERSTTSIIERIRHADHGPASARPADDGRRRSSALHRGKGARGERGKLG
jgi:D-beta-D-heptose 7-phosphate kinase / D-beta-D-heptose 1-phosphate adenosyltransferase